MSGPGVASFGGEDPVRYAGASRRFGDRLMSGPGVASFGGEDPVRYAGASRRFGGRIMYGDRFVKRPYRVVVAKPGLDGHDRGAKTITRALRDHGFEVIYTGLHQTPEQIAETALVEDVDAIGLSLLSGAHLTLFPRVIEELRSRELDDILVFGGGVIPEADARALGEQGVAGVFGPGSSLREISHWLEQQLDARED